MPPKATTTRAGKQPAATTTTTTTAMSAGISSVEKETLKAAYLRNATSSDLLDRLLQVLSALDALSNAELSTGIPVLSHLPKDFIAELLKGEYITNPSNDIRTIVALCLGCILGGGAAAVLVRGFGAPIPTDQFADSKCLDALKLICGTICLLRTAAGQQTRSYIRRLIEKCASRHVLHSLLQRLATSGADADSSPGSRRAAPTHDQTARAADVDSSVESLFQAILHGIDGDDNSMVVQLASLLNDVVDVHRSLTTTQLNLLLTAIVPRTATKTVDGKAAPLSTGVRIATAVLRRQADVLATAVCQEAVYSGVEAALEEIQQAELGDMDAAGQTDRKNAMRKLGTSLEVCIALCKVSTQLVSQMITLLQQHLESNNNDIRLIFIRSFSRIFVAVPDMTTEFSPAYHTFLSKFADSRPQIRAELVKYAKDAILVNPHVDPAWITLSPLLSNKLVDSDESVRRAAVTAVVDLALVVPKRVPNRLYEELSHRCKDKHQRVRQTAVEKLATLYAATKLAWIPNAVFTSAMISHGADISLVETALVTMLPAPSPANAAAAGVTPAQLANRKKQAKLGFTKKESFKFDFEGGDDTKGGENGGDSGADAAAAKNTITAAFATLCGHLNNESWQMMLALMKKKDQLRLTVRRLFEVRAAIKSKINVEANTEMARRLIGFLTTLCHCDTEWTSLFVEKDDTIGKQLALVCDPTCKDFFTSGEVQLLTKAKARAKSDMYTFLNDNVCKRLYLPLSEADANELVGRIDLQRNNAAQLAKAIAAGGASSSSSSSSSLEDIRKRHDREINRIHGSMRALMAIGSFAPQLLYPTAVVALCRWIREDAAAAGDMPSSSARGDTTKKTDMTKSIAMTLTILEGVVTSHRDATREQHTQAKRKVRDPLAAEVESDEESDDEVDVPLPAEVLDSRKEIITAIGLLCVRSPSADIAKAAAQCLTAMFQTAQTALKKLADTIKQKLTMVVVQVGGEGGGGDQASITLPAQLVSWIKALTVLFTNAPAIASHAFSDVVVDSIQQLLVIASRAHRNDIDDLDIKSRAVANQVLKSEDGAAHAHTRDTTATIALLTYNCPNAEIVDACSKALVKYALTSVDRARSNAAPALAADFVPLLFGSLVGALRDTSDLPTGSIGAAQKKLSIHKQILKLVVKAGSALTTVDPSFGAETAASPAKKGGKKGAAATTTTTASSQSANRGLTQGQKEILAKEISAMMLVSGEDQDIVRREAAKALKRYVVTSINKSTVVTGAPGADARHVAMLLMTAVLESSRGGYNELRSLVQEIHEKMVSVRSTIPAAVNAAATPSEPQPMHLGDHRAPRLFLEYCVPPLVLYMAHHPFFDEERRGGGGHADDGGATSEPAAPFKTFMRAWHLLFEELFHVETKSAAAVHEMFRKLRQLDDAIAKPQYEDATRVICDLGAKTMLAVLEEKSTSTNSHHQYPGALLIPNYFRPPQDPSQFPADRVYLPRNCQIQSHPVFGAPVGALASSVAPSVSRTPARVGGGLTGAPSQSRARSSSTAPPTATKFRPAATLRAEEDDDDNDSVVAPSISRTPIGSPTPKVATGQKRSRNELQTTTTASAVDVFADELLSAPNTTTTTTTTATKADVRKRLEMDEATTTTTTRASSSSPKKRSASVALPQTDDKSLTIDTRRKIMGVVHEMTSGKSNEELEKITFKAVKAGISAALQRPHTDGERIYAKECLCAAVSTMDAGASH